MNAGHVGGEKANGRNTLRRIGMTGFVVCSVAFVADVLAGKAAIVFGFDASFRIGVVAEFLVLLAVAAFFVVAALASEQIRGDGFEQPANQGRKT